MELNEEARSGLRSSFVKWFKRMLSITGGKDDRQLNEALAELGETEEEKKVIREVCEEIDTYYRKRQELVAAKAADPELTNGEWLANEIIKNGNEIARKTEGRDMTEGEQQTLLTDTNKALDEDAAAEANGQEHLDNTLNADMDNEGLDEKGGRI